jgi:hypothetical protein
MKKKKSQLKSNVVSFRLNGTQAKLLSETYKNSTPCHVKSDRAMARKIVCDFLAGRLQYTNPKDALVDMDAHQSEPVTA